MKRGLILWWMLTAVACGDRLPTGPDAQQVSRASLSASTLIGQSAFADVASVLSEGADRGVVAAHLDHPASFPLWQGVVAFPPRNEPNTFFADLQRLYRDELRRPQTAVSYLDPEGQNVWLTEYFRFYLNGCAHDDAIRRTLQEVTSGASLATCGVERLEFPPRDLPNAFQAQLEATYRDVLRRPQFVSYVDTEGANVWLAQYLRLRVAGGCDHTTAETKVFTEIRGGGVQPNCSGTGAVAPQGALYKGAFAAALTGDARIPAVAKDINGASFAIVGNAVAGGPGSIYTASAGDRVSLTLGADGRPFLLTAGNFIFVFANYTATAVDIAGIASDRQFAIQRQVPISLPRAFASGATVIGPTALFPSPRSLLAAGAQMMKIIACGTGVLRGSAIGGLPGYLAGSAQAGAACGAAIVDQMERAVGGDDEALGNSGGAIGSLPRSGCAIVDTAAYWRCVAIEQSNAAQQSASVTQQAAPQIGQAASQLAQNPAVSFAGTWAGSFTSGSSSGSFTFELSQTAQTVTGILSVQGTGCANISGGVSGSTLQFSLSGNCGAAVGLGTGTAQLSGNTMTGSISSGPDAAQFSATRR